MQILIFILFGCLYSNSNIFAEALESNWRKTDLISKVSVEKKADVIFEKFGASNDKANESNFYISKAKRLLEWNKEKLTSQSNLSVNDIKELFAPEFAVLANGRRYDANYQNYYDFLNKFRSDIETIDYNVQEYVIMDSTVVIPLKATVKRLQGEVDIFDVILLLKFNDLGKIVHWQEVYSVRKDL